MTEVYNLTGTVMKINQPTVIIRDLCADWFDFKREEIAMT